MARRRNRLRNMTPAFEIVLDVMMYFSMTAIDLLSFMWLVRHFSTVCDGYGVVQATIVAIIAVISVLTFIALDVVLLVDIVREVREAVERRRRDKR